MTLRHTIKEVNVIINNYGYELLNQEYKNNLQKLTLKDKEGYLYFISLVNILTGINPSAFHKANPYTIQNIKLWCTINSKPFELIGDIYDGNNKKLQWQCLKENCGEIFEAHWNAISNGTGCGVCSGQQVTLKNCLATLNPELTKEWHPTLNGDLTPYDITCGSHKYVWWQCKDNPKHKWETSVNNRTSNKSVCPYCSHTLPSEDYNLLINNPELSSEWDYNKNNKKPEEYLPHSNKKVWWICKKCSHEWNALICNRNIKVNPRGCPECNNFNRLGEKNTAWKGGINSENSKIRNSIEYSNWRNEIFKRDNYTCQCCGDSTGGNLVAHHILNFADNRDLIFDINNGITMCTNCHKPNILGSFHNIYGTRNNNLEQLIEYYNKFFRDKFLSLFLFLKFLKI